MKGPLNRTKVVLRHLPPSISRAMLTDQIDPKFCGRYSWLSFVPGNSSQKRIVHSRAYINFNKAEDVVDFAEYFNGHVFVNEKGAQYRAVVEYAPSQCVPKQWSKKDGREGTIFKDPEYMEFLEYLEKPVEHLPSAEIQLERREAVQAAAGKEALIITPLMDFIRQKRAASGGSRRLLSSGKSVRKNSRQSSESPGAASSKRSERRRVTKTMYVMRDTAKTTGSSKDRSSESFISKREDQQRAEKAVRPGGLVGDEASIDETGTTDIGKKKILLLKGKERDISHVKSSTVIHRPTPRRETGGRMFRNIPQPERQLQPSKVEKDRQPHPSNIHLLSKSRDGLSDDKITCIQLPEKADRRMRNKERPDRVVWTPLRRSDVSRASGADHSGKIDISVRSEAKVIGAASNQHPSVDNGSPINGSRRRLAIGSKDADDTVPDGKPARRAVSSSYNSQEENQMYPPKSATGGEGLLLPLLPVTAGKIRRRLQHNVVALSIVYLAIRKQVWVQKSSSSS